MLISFVLIGYVATVILLCLREYKIKKIHQQAVDKLQRLAQNANADTELYRFRAEQLEDGIKKDFNVPVRVIKNVIDAQFTKLEMVIILAGVHKLLQSAKTVEDFEWYISIIKKAQSFIDGMDE